MEREIEKVDVLYVVGGGSLIADDELKYSLRCLAKNAKNLGRVIISGNIPEWVSNEVVKVPCCDISVSGKHWNMLHKIEEGIVHANIRGDFLVSSDDHFITKPFNLVEWPRYTRGEIYDEEGCVAIYGHAPSKYQRSICATRRLLEKNGLEKEWTCWHGNTWLNAYDMNEVRRLADSDRAGSVYGYEPTLLYTAVRLKKCPSLIFQKLTSDVKASNPSDAINLAETRGMFSTSDKAWMNGKLKIWLNKTYGEKCEYER